MDSISLVWQDMAISSLEISKLMEISLYQERQTLEEILRSILVRRFVSQGHVSVISLASVADLSGEMLQDQVYFILDDM